MITFENVTKTYKGNSRPALDGLSLQVDRGEFVFIVGASGSGKSSCLQLILRAEQPTKGRVNVLGHDLRKISTRKVPFFRRNLGTVFQDFRLLQNKNVYENVAFSLQVIGKSRGYIQEAVPDALNLVGLAGKGKRYPHELSGGEQQRVAIARAIVNKPAILLADEPTGNLDPATSLGIMQLLQEINAAGTTVVMATHEATFVDIMKQRVVELADGVIVRDEVGGGYGETASIPLEDLRKAGLRAPKRTSEEEGRAAVAGLAVPIDLVGASPTEVPERGTIDLSDPTQQPADEAGLGFNPDPLAGDLPSGFAEADVEAGALAAGLAETEQAADGRVTSQNENAGVAAETTRERNQTSEFDPVKLAEKGGLAGKLGLRDDNQDVGPVR
ncbi:MAG: cell division ATP-binding protein FtsE [Microbacteriaceae bacterium]|nr:cell division ATP-binding protein FtsE [Microbacteriaceae bacterium]